MCATVCSVYVLNITMHASGWLSVQSHIEKQKQIKFKGRVYGFGDDVDHILLSAWTDRSVCANGILSCLPGYADYLCVHSHACTIAASKLRSIQHGKLFEY